MEAVRSARPAATRSNPALPSRLRANKNIVASVVADKAVAEMATGCPAQSAVSRAIRKKLSVVALFAQQ